MTRHRTAFKLDLFAKKSGPNFLVMLRRFKILVLSFLFVPIAQAETLSPEMLDYTQPQSNWYSASHWQIRNDTYNLIPETLGRRSVVLESKVDPADRFKTSNQYKLNLYNNTKYMKSSQPSTRIIPDVYPTSDFGDDPFYESIFLNQAGDTEACRKIKAHPACSSSF